MFAEFERHHARPGRSRRAADRRALQERIPQAAGALLRPRLRARRRAVAGVLPHPALLPGVLRLQVRHGPVGRDRPGRARHRRRQAGAGRLPRLPQGAAAPSTRSTCCAARASTWSSPRPSTRPWPISSGWSASWTRCCNAAAPGLAWPEEPNRTRLKGAAGPSGNSGAWISSVPCSRLREHACQGQAWHPDTGSFNTEFAAPSTCPVVPTFTTQPRIDSPCNSDSSLTNGAPIGTCPR